MENYFTYIELQRKTIRELKMICRIYEISDIVDKTRNELINMILGHQNNIIYPRRKNSLATYLNIKFKRFIYRFCDKAKEGYSEQKNFFDIHPEYNDCKEEDEYKQCIICFENKRIFAGKCGHFVLCGKCSIDIFYENESLCPICRKPWEDIRQIFI